MKLRLPRIGDIVQFIEPKHSYILLKSPVVRSNHSLKFHFMECLINYSSEIGFLYSEMFYSRFKNKEIVINLNT